MTMTNVKLAELLLLRKQYQQKVDQLKSINHPQLFETKHMRKQVNEQWDDVVLQVPLLDAKQFTHEYDWYAKQLRVVDAAIQQANWGTSVSIDSTALQEYTAPARPGPRGAPAVKG